MKDKKLRKLIQKPLRFHHQDIHEELDNVRLVLAKILLAVEDIKLTLKETPDETSFSLRSSASGPSTKGGAQSGEVPRAEATDAG